MSDYNHGAYGSIRGAGAKVQAEASASRVKFNAVTIQRTEDGVENIEFWLLANAKWNRETGRFQRLDLDKNSFGIQVQAAGTYPGEAALGYTDNQAIGFWRAIGRETFRASGDTAAAAAVTEDIGVEAGGKWKTFGVYQGWNNCQMLDSYGGMTIGGHGFEIDGNGLYPYARVSYSKNKAEGYALLGLLWNAFHGLSGSDDAQQADWAIGLKAPIKYWVDGEYDENSNMVQMNFATLALMRRAAGEAEYRAIYELDDYGWLRVRRGGEIELDATVLDDTSAQALYTGALTKDNTDVRYLRVETTDGSIDGAVITSVTKTQYGVLVGYSGYTKAEIASMKIVVWDSNKNYDIDLSRLSWEQMSRLEQLAAGGTGGTAGAGGGSVVSVNGVSPDDSGNVTLDGTNIELDGFTLEEWLDEKQDRISATGLLKRWENGSVVQAVAGEDYQAPLTGTKGKYLGFTADNTPGAVDLPSASTGSKGITYLVDSYTRNDTDKAVTPRALNAVYQLTQTATQAMAALLTGEEVTYEQDDSGSSGNESGTSDVCEDAECGDPA